MDTNLRRHDGFGAPESQCQPPLVLPWVFPSGPADHPAFIREKIGPMHAQAPPESEGAMQALTDQSQGGAVASSGSNGSKMGNSPIMYPNTWRTVSGGGCLQVKLQVSGFLSRSF